MQHIVVAAKAGAEEPWVADAAAELAVQTGASASVVSVDGRGKLEGLSALPRSEFTERARRSAEAMAERLRSAGRGRDGRGPPGRVVLGILMSAEERDADLIVVVRPAPGALSLSACWATCRWSS